MLNEWSARQNEDWSLAVMGPFPYDHVKGYGSPPPHRIYSLPQGGTSRWISDEGGWEPFLQQEFIIQLIQNRLRAEPSLDRRFPVDKVGYYGVTNLNIRPEPNEWSWSSIDIQQRQWRDWENHQRDPRWPVYRKAFCEIRRLLRRKATLYSRRSGPMTVGVSSRNATPGFRDLVASRPGFGNLVIEEVPLHPGLSLYDVEGILKPEDFLE
ncbi:hypothetical protein BH11ARM2_BH11ARM2_39640 [soil metagenome]